MSYPEQRSRVQVFKRDGSIETYAANVGPGIAPWLAEQSGRTGFLTLLDGPKAVSIPVETIDRFEITLIQD